MPTITTVAGDGTRGYSGDGGPATSAELEQTWGIAEDSAGNLYVADEGNSRIREVNASTGIITTVAGDGMHGYSGDGGLATGASLDFPEGVAVDSAGNIYIADTENMVVREVNAATGIITTIAGGGTSGDMDGVPATSIELIFPDAVAVGSAGDVYIADNGLDRVLEVNASTGIITTVAGDGRNGYSGDGGLATGAELDGPEGVAVDSAGNIYIADSMNGVVREVNARTGIITTIAGDGTNGYSGDGGPATGAEMDQPYGVTVGIGGNLYIATSGNRVREVNTATGIISTVAGDGTAGYSGDGGPATSAELDLPFGVVQSSTGDLYIADFQNNRIRKVGPLGVTVTFPSTTVGGSTTQSVLLELTAAQSVTSITAAKSLGGAQEFTIGAISGCTVDGSTVNAADTICTVPVTFKPVYPGQRNVPLTVVTNTGTYKVALSGIGTGPQVALTPGTISTLAGNGTAGYSGDGGAATSAEVNVPNGIAVDNAGNLYIGDSNNDRVREVNASTGIITTVAGDGTQGYSGDGGVAASAELNAPYGVAVDAAGNLYIADSGNDRVREVDASTGVITTVAGNGTNGYSGDGGPATSAELASPVGVAVDAAGNLYIAEAASNHIREVNASTGVITTVAGNGTAGSSGDGGPAISAELHEPQGIAVDGSGNLYIADTLNNRIREINAVTGIITTVAGNGTAGASGDGGPATSAELDNPDGVAVDAAGNLYIGNYLSDRIREVSAATGIITTVAGDGTAGASGDGGPATSAELNGPVGVAVDSAGNLYIADNFNERIREVNVITPPILTFKTATGVGQTDSTDGAQTVAVTNTGNMPLTFTVPGTGTNPSYPTAFPVNGSATNLCSSTASPLAVGGSCNVSFNFEPTVAGANTGSIVLTDDAENVSSTTQSISLSGAGIATPTITWATPAAIPYGTALSATQLDATASVPGTFVYSPAAGTVLSPGTEVLSVTFTPTDTTDYSTATATVDLTVAGTPTMTQLSSSINPSQPGQAVTFSALVSTGGAAPTGTVTFTDGGTTIGTASVTTATTTNLILDSDFRNGSWSLTAGFPIVSGAGPGGANAFVYTGTGAAAGYMADESQVITVAPGDTYTLSGYIDGTAVTAGSVVWAVYNTALSVGYAGAPGAPGASGRVSATFTVPAGVTQVVVICDATSATVTNGGKVVFSEPQLEQASSVGPYIETGTASATGSGGLATISDSSLPAGSNAITAAYSGDTDDAASSGTMTQTVAQNLTMTQLSSSLNPSQAGQPVTLSALVSTGGAIPTGTVTFSSGGTTIGTATLTKVTTTNLIPDSDFRNGSWSLTAGSPIVSGAGEDDSNAFVYTGTGAAAGWLYDSSLAITVVPGDTYILSGYIDATQVTGTIAPSWAVFNTAITTAYVETSVAPGTSGRSSVTFTAPAGVTQVVVLCDTNNMTVTNGGKVIYSEPQFEQASSVGPYVETGTASATGSGGLATISDSSLPAGSDAITAAYSGDTGNAASSGTLTQTVTQTTPTVSAWPTAGGITYGESLASSTLTGGTASVAGTFAWTSSTTIPTATGTEAEGVTFTPTNTADYATVTGTVDVAVAKSSIGVTVSSSLDPSIYGDTVSYTFDFIGVAGMAVPTGEATITAGGTSIGTVTLNPSGEATLSISTLLAGTDTIKAVYGGDANYE